MPQGDAIGSTTPDVSESNVAAYIGHAGMEAAVANLCEPGETILIINTGIWGVRAAELSRRYGGVWLPAMHHTSRMQLYMLSPRDLCSREHKADARLC